MKPIDDFRFQVLSSIDNEVTIDGINYPYTLDTRIATDYLVEEIDEIIKLTAKINEKNRSIKELNKDKDKDEKKKLIKEKNEDWEDFKNKYNLNDVNTKKLMLVDTVEKYKEFAQAQFFYGGPIEILTTAESHQINFCIVNADLGTFETFFCKIKSDDYAFMFRKGLHFQPYYKNIDINHNQFIFKRSEVSETILSLFSANEDEQNFYYKICEEFDKVKTGSSVNNNIDNNNNNNSNNDNKNNNNNSTISNINSSLTTTITNNNYDNTININDNNTNSIGRNR
jgi:hypothetical protein